MRYRIIASGHATFANVSAIGFGCMALDNRPGNADRAEQTVRAALDTGVTFFDTADSYGDRRIGRAAGGSNEARIGVLLRQFGVADQVLVGTKVGHLRDVDGGWIVSSPPEHIRQAIDGSLARLGRDHIDLYQHHRPDPAVDYADSLGALREVYDAGKALMIGISNVNGDQIRLAKSILGDALVTVQNEYSPNYRGSEAEIVLCEQLGLTFLPWGPFGGIGRADRLGEAHGVFAEIAAEIGVSPHRTCLAWMLRRSPAILPIPGASRPSSVIDSAQAIDVHLTEEQFNRLEAHHSQTEAPSEFVWAKPASAHE